MQYKHSMLRYLFILAIFTGSLVCLQADDSASVMFDKGKTYYANGKYLEALYFFNELIKDNSTEYLGDAWFWSSKSYLASGDIENAEKNLEYFLLNFPRNSNYNEGFYYKGRILFIEKEYEKAIELFNRFIRTNPFSPFVSNSYFWIGECLYNTGHFNEARQMYEKVVTDYKSSYKFEASQYKIELIDLRSREEELLQLIRWSHEESTKTIEEYKNREKSYLQTISAYQKKLQDLESAQAENENKALNRLNAAAQKLEDYLKNLENQKTGSEADGEN